MERFVDVILPLPLPGGFTYLLPPELEESVRDGCRVVVPFGRKKFYTGIVERIHALRPEGYEVKEVLAVLDARPVLLPVQFRFWKWLSDYYLCTLGDVYKAALPSGLKLESETVVELNPDFEAGERLPEREQCVLDLLAEEPALSVTKLEQRAGIKNILAVLNALLSREAVFVKEELKRTYKPKTETRVRLAPDARNEHRLHIFFDELQRRAPKQLDLLMKYLEQSGAPEFVCILGSFTASAAVVLPSFILVLGICKMYNKFQNNRILDGVLSGLKPAVAGLIGAAAVILITPENFPDWKSWVLFAAAFAASWWWKANPILTIVAGGLLGLILY